MKLWAAGIIELQVPASAKVPPAESSGDSKRPRNRIAPETQATNTNFTSHNFD